ncbi:unnamed protein product [Notodromas monacha]|uniref:SHSP domain-containing protein n=1 Tax=Notodromas monacha TaxID=399045 RepID=A0A7R9BQP9_9CRUS|nr:unnamed protein product [Notodromas monacha]CAD7283144.1 unnamed protein product [Notodromas monacha]CAG0919888.1 unnamed protein product [Notodromas monacha]CAG0923296.1 unnamed protein product [Notodromas monacha]
MDPYTYVPFIRDWHDGSAAVATQAFGIGMYPSEVNPVNLRFINDMHAGNWVRPAPPPPIGAISPYYTPSSQQQLDCWSRFRSGVSAVANERSKFQIMLDVQQFCPNEIVVKTIDNYIVIEGKHEEKEDEHGYVARHFVRRYLLPKGVKPESITSTISCDGVLTIAAPKETTGSCEVRQIQVKPVNKPVLCSTCPTGVCGLQQKSIHEAPRASMSHTPPTAASPRISTGPATQQSTCLSVCATAGPGQQAQLHIAPVNNNTATAATPGNKRPS